MIKLIGHLFMEQPTLPPMPWPYGYVIAQNGVFAWAKREGLEALIPVAPCRIAGLYPVEPFVTLLYPVVYRWFVRDLLNQARAARMPDGQRAEMLFYLNWERERWRLTVPEQEQHPMEVTPILNTLAAQTRYASTLLEIHSHHTMSAFFSRQDNADAQGFRLDGVLGWVEHAPVIRMRVGIYGHFWEIPARWALDLPEEVTDYATKQES